MKKNKLITHNGSFHSDDIFACAALSILLEKRGEGFEVIRTRDEEIIKAGDYVFDVGGVYDEKTNRFDHHQVGGAGKRDNGIEYSSFGLVWKKFGAELCTREKAVEILDQKLVAPVDAFDNGIDLVENKFKVSPYLIEHFFFSMRPTWREEDITNDEMFLKSVEIAKLILKREITQVEDFISAEDKVISAYRTSEDKRIIVLDNKYPWGYALNNFSEPMFVVFPRKADNNWGVEAIRNDPKTFKNRKDFPVAWAGLRDEEIAKVSSVPDAIFCHRGLWLAVAKTKEGAVSLAQKALSE